MKIVEVVRTTRFYNPATETLSDVKMLLTTTAMRRLIRERPDLGSQPFVVQLQFEHRERWSEVVLMLELLE